MIEKTQGNAAFNIGARSNLVAHLKDTTFDVLVIGGGITGAGIALDAITRGLNVALVEKNDFAEGTSSRSTKLIHGGLRYLKQLEINLVREVGQEREVVHQNAPHIVQPEKMLLPLYEGGSLGKRATALGLLVYDQLAGVIKDERRTMHSPTETLAIEPLLRKNGLLGSGLYYEYQSSDARLTIEVLKAAVQRGATAINYAKAVKYHYNDAGKATGTYVNTRLPFAESEKQEILVRAKHIVNATGPWVDKLRAKDKAIGKKRLHLTKGVHIVIPYNLLPLQQAVYFDVFHDGRMIFAIPRGETIYIGTTDTNYKGKIGNPTTNAADVEYLLSAVAQVFPFVSITKADIISSWAGLRPLIHKAGKAPSELSRKDELFVSDSGVLSIAGGKLTGYRKMAERTVDKIEKELFKATDRSIVGCQTKQLALSGGQLPKNTSLKEYGNSIVARFISEKLSKSDLLKWVNRYGTNTPLVVAAYRQLLHSHPNVSHTLRMLLAELHYCTQYEMLVTLSDFLVRRTAMLYFERQQLMEYLDPIAQELQTLLHLSDQTIAQQKERVLQASEAAVNFA